jgi:two-component system phosphate regulon sensor histidine kinase PhoR
MTQTFLTLFIAAAFLGMALVIYQLKKSRAECQEQTRVWKRRLEADLERARGERDRLLDALGDAVFLIDSTMAIRFANKAASDLFGGRKLLGRSVNEAFLDPRLTEALLRCVATGEPVQSRVVLSQQTSPRGDLENRGVNAWIIDAAPFPVSPGEANVTRVVIRDVTSEHQLEQVRKDFVANASHELRTPLAIINGYLENLLEDDMIIDPAMSRRFLQIMRKHTDRISRIVEDMLVISRLESGEANALNIEPFKFRACISDILERLESLIHQHDTKVDVDLPDTEIVLQADRFYLTQVLFNLVENALKQNPRPGLHIHVGCKAINGHIEIWIADNGVGIPSADLPHIFRRFYRVEKHHSQQEIKGTGLGLSIVKRAIEAHHGTVSVTSVPGRETKFLITLPVEAVQGDLQSAEPMARIDA